MFDPTKPVQTRDGRPARIIAADRKGDYPIVALVGNEESVLTFRSDGRYLPRQDNAEDLINIPTREVRYVALSDLEENGRVRFGGTVRDQDDPIRGEHGWGNKALKITFEDGRAVAVELDYF